MANLGVVNVVCEVVDVKNKDTQYGMRQEVVIRTADGFGMFTRYVKEGQRLIEVGDSSLDIAIYTSQSNKLSCYVG